MTSKQIFIKSGFLLLRFYALLSVLFFTVMILAFLNKGIFMLVYLNAISIFEVVTDIMKHCTR